MCRSGGEVGGKKKEPEEIVRLARERGGAKTVQDEAIDGNAMRVEDGRNRRRPRVVSRKEMASLKMRPRAGEMQIALWAVVAALAYCQPGG